MPRVFIGLGLIVIASMLRGMYGLTDFDTATLVTWIAGIVHGIGLCLFLSLFLRAR